MRALGQIGVASPEVIAALRRQLTMTAFQSNAGWTLQEPRTRVLALQSLVLLADDSAATLPDLMPLLDDHEHGIRIQAALAIGPLPGDRRQAIGRLVETLADPNVYARTAAALALAEIGPDARVALPTLRNCLCDSRNNVPNSGRRIANRLGTTLSTLELSFMPGGIDLRQVSVADAARLAIAAIEKLEPSPVN